VDIRGFPGERASNDWGGVIDNIDFSLLSDAEFLEP